MEKQVGDKIKTFTVVNIVDGIGKNYDDFGNATPYATKYMLLLSERGEQRVLEIGKTNLNDCVRYYGWSKFKFAKWSMI
jgi:hypothetical protein